MDYTNEPLRFRAKKAIRYTRLYGPRRTLAKARGQYHMRKQYDTLPPLWGADRDEAHIGIIGCGNFAYSTIAYYLKKNYGRVLRGLMDIDVNRAASLCE